MLIQLTARFFIMIDIILYGVMANIFYSCGEITQIIYCTYWKEKAKFNGEKAFKLGLFFSIGLSLLPCLFFIAIIINSIF